jgi:PAS domain S-box-containing protein
MPDMYKAVRRTPPGEKAMKVAQFIEMFSGGLGYTFIEQLMTIALQNAGAERGLLILIRDGDPRIEAEAATGQGKIEVAARHAAITPSDLPQSVLHYVIRTEESVLLDDASTDKVYSKDEYVQRQRCRSVLCIPIVKQKKLVGALYLENNLAPFVFTPGRATVLQLLASQAAISLENAALYSDLQRSEAFLAEGQRISRTGSFGWNVASGEIYWSQETYNIVEYDRAAELTFELAFQRIHPDDRDFVKRTLDEATQKRTGFDMELRFLVADGRVKHAHIIGRAVQTSSGNFEFVGAVTDITERKEAEYALRHAHAELAHANRVTTMGELAASLAHEINQPITAAIAYANACRRWLERDEPGLDQALAAVANIVKDGQRAAQIIARIRAQFEKGALNQEVLEVSEIVRETVGLLRGEAARYDISVRTELTDGLPQIVGDRVQLQQVAMNLIVNSIEAMKDVDGKREMVIRSQRAENEQIFVSVTDTGIGVPPQLAEQIFDPFFTTKAHGTGMGLRISRSIVESHGGRLWVTGAPGRGAVFQFTLPVAVADRN